MTGAAILFRTGGACRRCSRDDTVFGQRATATSETKGERACIYNKCEACGLSWLKFDDGEIVEANDANDYVH